MPASETDLAFTLVESRVFRTTIRFACPGCDLRLRSRLFEVGDQDSCPQCDSPFTVPGPQNCDGIVERDSAKIAALQKLSVDWLRIASKHFSVFFFVAAFAYVATANRGAIKHFGSNVIEWVFWTVVVVAMMIAVLFVVIGLPLLLLSSSSGKTGLENPITMIFCLCVCIPLGPPGWLLLAFLIGYSNTNNK